LDVKKESIKRRRLEPATVALRVLGRRIVRELIKLKKKASASNDYAFINQQKSSYYHCLSKEQR
jgi:hypothetical protein